MWTATAPAEPVFCRSGRRPGWKLQVVLGEKLKDSAGIAAPVTSYGCDGCPLLEVRVTDIDVNMVITLQKAKSQDNISPGTP